MLTTKRNSFAHSNYAHSNSNIPQNKYHYNISQPNSKVWILIIFKFNGLVTCHPMINLQEIDGWL